MLGQVDLLEEAVGLLDPVDAREPELLGQALLQGGDHALRPPPGLGRIGRDELYVELLKPTVDLGRLVLVHRAAGIRRVPVVAGPVGRMVKGCGWLMLRLFFAVGVNRAAGFRLRTDRYAEEQGEAQRQGRRDGSGHENDVERFP